MGLRSVFLQESISCKIIAKCDIILRKGLDRVCKM